MKSVEVNRPLDVSVVLSQHLKEGRYWLNKLSGEWEKSCFPVSNRKKVTRGDKMQSITTRFTGEIFEKLMKLCNGSDPRLFMIITAGLSALLFKYTGSRDIVLGTPVLKQNIEAEFINIALALRNQITNHMTFKELLLQVKQTIVEATEHQNYPVEQLPELLNIPFPKEGDFPLFDIAVLLENIHEKTYLRDIPLNMIFSFTLTPHCIEGTIQYNPVLYNVETIERIRDHFHLLLHKALANIDIRMAEIDILGEEEKKQLLHDFNNTQKDCPRDIFIHRLFQEQVEKTPDRTALIFEDEELTYRALDKRANQLAQALKEKGGVPGAIVGIVSTPSLTMAVGILGILTAGRAYLPIDPNYPGERVAFILADSSSPILVKSGKYEIVNRTVNILDADDPSIYRGNGITAAVPVRPAHPVYIIYTSGTTGQPKGVVVEHQHAANMLIYRKAEYRMDEGTVSLQLFSYAFDGFVTSFFTPVISGAKQVLLSNEALLDLDRIKGAFCRHRVTHFISVPSLFQAILEAAEEKDMVSLETVTLAGEQLLPKIVEMAKQKHKNLEIVHEYGVTEAAVMSTLYRHQERDNRITIGRPIWNTRTYIFNNEMELQPIGVPGELCIGGAGAARGYLNQPQLTAEKFIELEVKVKVKDYRSYRSHRSYIYRTGDLARWLPDGNIEFLGRIDNQVKIWGFRIEPGEIQSRLLEHKDITRAAVIPIDAPGKSGAQGQHLCAYFVSKAVLTGEDLREFLLERLPDYMVPAYFMPVDSIPLNENGKINRKALPEPKIEGTADAFIPPRDGVEIEVGEIWSEVLEVKKEMLGIDINFFEYGGYSIKATRLINKIHQKTNVRIPLAEMFSRPTIRALSEYVKKAKKERFISLKPVEKRNYYPVSSAQKRLYLIQQMEPDNLSYNVLKVVLLEGDVDISRLEKTFRNLLKRHETLRTSFHLIDGELVQGVCQDIDFEIEYYDSKNAHHDQADAAGIIARFVRSFDLSHPPLMRVGLIKPAHTPSALRGHPSQEGRENKYLLMVDMHHIISDATSNDVLTAEFINTYAGKELAPLRIQYKDYAGWQNSEPQKEAVKKQAEYWLKIFAGKVPVLNLPTDYPRPRMRSFEGNTFTFTFDSQEMQELNTLARDNQSTLFMVLLALFSIFLSKISGQQDIVVGTTVEGRGHEDLARVIGIFVNFLALSQYPKREMTFVNFLKEVRENTLSAFENQDYPFEALVEKVMDNRDSSHNPLFDVMFQFQAAALGQGKTEGLQAKPYQYNVNQSKLDLTLWVTETRKTLVCSFEYCTKLFKEDTIQCFSKYFKEIVRDVLAAPSRTLTDIEIVPEDKKLEILSKYSSDMEEEWNE
jgi:amino acid adenylation domain-containing protein